MIETLAEHLYLDDAIQGTVFQITNDFFLLVRIQLAVDDLRPVSALFIERPDALSMIDRARDRDDLVLGAGQAELFNFLEAVIDNAYVARIAQGNAAAEPLFVLHRENFIEREGTFFARYSEGQRR